MKLQHDSNGSVNFGPWEAVVRVLILGWFVLYTLSIIPELHPYVGRISLRVTHWINYLFIAEYVFRLLLSRPRLGYALSNLGLLDLIVCVTGLCYLWGVDVQILNSLRIVRVFAIFKLARFSVSASHFYQAFRMIRRELLFFTAVLLFMLYITSLGIYMTEHAAQPEKFASFLDALWFSVESLSTVGYGDVVPITPMGRFFTGFIMFIAVAVVAVATGLISAAFTKVWHYKHPPTPSGPDVGDN